MARTAGKAGQRASRVKGGREASPWTGEQLRRQLPAQPRTERQERRSTATGLRDSMDAPGEGEAPTTRKRRS